MDELPINYSIKTLKETLNLYNDKEIAKERIQSTVVSSQDLQVTDLYKERKIRRKTSDYLYISEPENGPVSITESTKLDFFDRQDESPLISEKNRRKSLATFNDIDQQIFLSKNSPSSNAFELSAIPKMDESVNFNRQQILKSSDPNGAPSKTNVKMRNKTLTQLSNRRSLNSCLSSLIMTANSKESTTSSSGSIAITSSSSSSSSINNK